MPRVLCFSGDVEVQKVAPVGYRSLYDPQNIKPRS